MDRKCGVLMPVASLPGKFGIGGFTKEAYDFVDFLAAAGQTYWQILPLGQTGYGDSPYQTFSAFAGNAYFIDVEKLIEAGYITAKFAESQNTGDNAEEVDYAKVYETRFPLLRKAYDNSPFALNVKDKWADAKYDADRKAFEAFIADNAEWLPDYGLYSAVKKEMGGTSFLTWDDDIRLRKSAALKKYTKELADEIRFNEFIQFLFFAQWTALKEYANEKGIKIIGDIPIYVAADSADTWSHPELFELDSKGFPTVVAGCPPDAFSATGQLWGNPIYKWAYHKETGYAWWIQRIAMCFKLYDVVRIDHFRGFDAFYTIPYGDKTAENGEWWQGPGYDLFDAIKKALGKKEIIAEDLGFITDSVRKLVKKTGYPSMKVLQFAFDSRGMDSDYLPHNYTRNCVVYTGTHDNETMRGWYENVYRGDRLFAKRYCNIHNAKTAAWEFIRVAMACVADTCIIPMQDYLNLGDETRINTPSTLGGNWVWRMKDGAYDEELSKKMKDLAQTYARV